MLFLFNCITKAPLVTSSAICSSACSNMQRHDVAHLHQQHARPRRYCRAWHPAPIRHAGGHSLRILSSESHSHERVLSDTLLYRATIWQSGIRRTGIAVKPGIFYPRGYARVPWLRGYIGGIAAGTGDKGLLLPARRMHGMGTGKSRQSDIKGAAEGDAASKNEACSRAQVSFNGDTTTGHAAHVCPPGNEVCRDIP